MRIGFLGPRRPRTNGIDIEFNSRTGRITYNDLGSYQSRISGVMHLFFEALRTVKTDLRSFRTFVHTGDVAGKRRGGHHCAFARRRDQGEVVLIPDFFFWYWPEVGVYDYAELVREMQEAGSRKPVDDRLFWVGNLTTHANREILWNLAQDRDDMLIQSIS